MSSVNFNAAALSALQALNQTQQSLNTVQSQVSTGLAVATAADNSSYWSVAAQLSQNDGIVNAANTALTTGQSMLTTATNAINSVITTLNSMATALTEAQNPNANLGAINTSLQSLGAQLTDAVTNASFNGLNMLDGSITTSVGATTTTGVNFVSGYNATSNGGTVNTIGMATQMVYGNAQQSSTSAAVTSSLSLSGAAVLTFAQSTPVTGVFSAYSSAGTTALASISSATPSVNSTTKFADYQDTANDAYVTQQYNSNGTITQTTYTALDSNGESKTGSSGTTTGGTFTAFTAAGGVASFSVQSETYTPEGAQAAGLLNQDGIDTTQLGSSGESIISSGTAANALTAVNAALTAVTNYAATIGATQDRMTAASTFNSALDTNLQTGIAGLVDANMNTASTQLQALQTQEQLGIQSLSIANQNSQLILKLFQ